MANYNCSACDDLRNDAPNFVTNGLTNTEIASLENNTGLNPSNSNDDCEDLNNMNDCLIGNMEDEIELYDVCEWKTYMKQYVPNTHIMFGGIIAAICGLWTNIKNLWSKVNGYNDKINGFCDLIDQMISPSVPIWGTLPLATTPTAIARRCGAATNKVAAQPGGGDAPPSLKPAQNIGLYYTNMTVTSCKNGRQEMLEWIAPSTFLYDLKAGATSGDILWKITKSEAQSKMGMSDYLWETFSISSWTWHETALDDRQMAWLRIVVGEHGLADNELGVVFLGCTAPNNAISSDISMTPLGAERCKIFRHYI